jgi:hypothetical protein
MHSMSAPDAIAMRVRGDGTEALRHLDCGQRENDVDVSDLSCFGEDVCGTVERDRTRSRNGPPLKSSSITVVLAD